MGNEAQRAKLRSPQEPPPYFAGRATELAALNNRLADLRETDDPTGGMALIVGVPGAGKTQLGRKFAEDAVARDASHLRHLAVDTTMLEDDVDLFMAVARALDAEAAGRKAAELDTRSTGRSGGIGSSEAASPRSTRLTQAACLPCCTPHNTRACGSERRWC